MMKCRASFACSHRSFVLSVVLLLAAFWLPGASSTLRADITLKHGNEEIKTPAVVGTQPYAPIDISQRPVGSFVPGDGNSAAFSYTEVGVKDGKTVGTDLAFLWSDAEKAAHLSDIAPLWGNYTRAELSNYVYEADLPGPLSAGGTFSRGHSTIVYHPSNSNELPLSGPVYPFPNDLLLGCEGLVTGGPGCPAPFGVTIDGSDSGVYTRTGNMVAGVAYRLQGLHLVPPGAEHDITGPDGFRMTYIRHGTNAVTESDRKDVAFYPYDIPPGVTVPTSTLIIKQNFVIQHINNNKWAIGLNGLNTVLYTGGTSFTSFPAVDPDPSVEKIFSLNDQNQIVGTFAEGNGLFERGQLLLLNDPKVIPAYLAKEFGTITPVYISNQRIPRVDVPPNTPQPPYDPTIHILAGYSNEVTGQGGYLVLKRDQHGIWSVSKVQVPDSTRIGYGPLSINSQGVIAASTSENHAAMLVPVDMQVDANRDGQISPDYAEEAALPIGGGLNGSSSSGGPTVQLPSAPPDVTSPENPYRFWINDDDDGDPQAVGYPYPGVPTSYYLYDGEEGTTSSTKDYSADSLKTKRGLEDFSRLWLHLPLLGSQLQSGTIKLGLRWKANLPAPDNTPLPKIKLFRATVKGTDYLTDDVQAREQVLFDPSGRSDDYLKRCPAIRNKDGGTVVDGNQTFVLPKEFWQDVGLGTLTSDVYLLFEGVGDGGKDLGGKGCLEYVFLDAAGNETGHGGGVYLDLCNIRSMYTRGKAWPNDMDAPRGEGYPQPERFLYTQPLPMRVHCLDDPAGYPPLPAWNDDNTQCLTYVHGWSNNYDEAQTDAQTILKRLWQRGYQGRFACFRWPTFRKNDLKNASWDFTFNVSEYRAWKYGPALTEFLERLRGGLATGAAINVAAHSQGNVVVGSALCPRDPTIPPARINNYLLMHAAVSASCYDVDLPEFKDFTDRDASIPTPQTLIEGGYSDSLQSPNPPAERHGRLEAAVGHLVNFYDKPDSALSKMDTENTFFKPVAKGLFSEAQYDYDPTKTDLENRSRLFMLETAVMSYRGGVLTTSRRVFKRNVLDTDERMAFIARSMTHPVGAEGNTGGPVNREADAFDLQPFVDKLHSGERELPLQHASSPGNEIYRIYDQMLRAIRKPGIGN